MSNSREIVPYRRRYEIADPDHWLAECNRKRQEMFARREALEQTVHNARLAPFMKLCFEDALNEIRKYITFTDEQSATLLAVHAKKVSDEKNGGRYVRKASQEYRDSVQAYKNARDAAVRQYSEKVDKALSNLPAWNKEATDTKPEQPVARIELKKETLKAQQQDDVDDMSYDDLYELNQDLKNNRRR